MKKIIFAVALLVAITGVSVSKAEAIWFFNKKAEIKSDTNTSANSAAVRKTGLFGLFNKKAETTNDTNTSNNSIEAIKGESETAKLVIGKAGEGFDLLSGGSIVKSNTDGTLVVEMAFGSSVVSLTVKTDGNTKVFRHFDGRDEYFLVKDIAVGDTLSVEGTLVTTAGSLTVMAKRIKDFSVQGRDARYSGIIKTINTSAKSFALDINGDTDLTVFVVEGTILGKIVKSLAPEIVFEELAVGDVVKLARGPVNTQTMTMIAKEVVISERDIVETKIKDVFATVVSVDAGNSMVVRTGTNINYTVNLKNTNTQYNKWTISKKYSGVKKGSKTDGVTEVTTLGGLVIVAGDKVWVSGTVKTGGIEVDPTLIEKEFYK